jgi:hypothetical protein
MPRRAREPYSCTVTDPDAGSATGSAKNERSFRD